VNRRDRRLIVNADDFGLSAGVNAGVARAFLEGIVTSASLLVRGPGAAAAAEFRHTHPALSLGLHVDLGEWTLRDGAWEPVYLRAPLEDEVAVRREVAAQLDQFRALTGVTPTHVDSHQHVHRHEPVRTVLVEIAAMLDVPLRHCSAGVRYCGTFYGQGDDGTPHPEWISAAALAAVVAALPGGTTELCCHPAAVDDVDTLYRQERVVELQTLCDPSSRRAVEAEGIRLCSFATVQEGA